MKVIRKGNTVKGGSDKWKEKFRAAVLAFVPEGQDVAGDMTFKGD